MATHRFLPARPHPPNRPKPPPNSGIQSRKTALLSHGRLPNLPRPNPSPQAGHSEVRFRRPQPHRVHLEDVPGRSECLPGFGGRVLLADGSAGFGGWRLRTCG
uniref:(northern house mosquito) hypothetical protein n=1 Tax=Culex pipiens TaxID=7175 RepID=A0A8D8FI78_CULPI